MRSAPDAAAPVARAAERFEADLPPGTRDVIYVDVQNLPRGCGPPLPPGVHVIDDRPIE